MNEFDPAKESREVGISLGHVGFVRPDAVIQPSKQVNIVGNASAKLLGRVNVGVDESGEQDLAVEVDELVLGLTGKMGQNVERLANGQIGRAHV